MLPRSCGLAAVPGVQGLDFDMCRIMADVGKPAAPAPAAVRTKLLMLAAPFLKRWSYSRIAEQVG